MAAELYHSVGKRKTSVARIWMKPGSGVITVNNKSFEDYFVMSSGRNVIKQPLEITDTVGKYDILINVKGGGISGQAGAVRHGITRALIQVNPEFRGPLKKASLVTRDSRIKERKKYGQPGARARFQYSKR
ncbi:MAG: 30S ribosomal protein S9 [Deltaproteobacteria bacterium]|jgi:small subunit ribosomal protein S9|nr:30S ribosomal protein S9 [Deltaproteobacteria bacterium]MBW1915915.1 30S ribosomal protein S9 [Deltaproteobacteria bacterium]